ncbi:hypothetical protein V8C44DRAFT_113126 [Trichoderma aethiopicum]
MLAGSSTPSQMSSLAIAESWATSGTAWRDRNALVLPLPRYESDLRPADGRWQITHGLLELIRHTMTARLAVSLTFHWFQCVALLRKERNEIGSCSTGLLHLATLPMAVRRGPACSLPLAQWSVALLPAPPLVIVFQKLGRHSSPHVQQPEKAIRPTHDRSLTDGKGVDERAARQGWAFPEVWWLGKNNLARSTTGAHRQESRIPDVAD